MWRILYEPRAAHHNVGHLSHVIAMPCTRALEDAGKCPPALGLSGAQRSAAAQPTLARRCSEVR